MWKPITEAPRNGSPVWARGRYFHQPTSATFCTWAFWDGKHWREQGMGGMILSFLEEFLVGAGQSA